MRKMIKNIKHHLILLVLGTVAHGRYQLWLSDNSMPNCWWMYLSEWCVVFAAASSLLHEAGLKKYAVNFNCAVVYPISIMCAMEQVTVSLLGNGLLQNYRLDVNNNPMNLLLVLGIALNSFLELKSTETPVSTRNRQMLLIVEALYFLLVLHNYAKQKTWPYGFLESAGPVNFLFGTG